MLSDEPAIAMCVSTYVCFLGKVNIQMFSELLFSQRNSDGSHTLHGHIAVDLQLVIDFYRAFLQKLILLVLPFYYWVTVFCSPCPLPHPLL